MFIDVVRDFPANEIGSAMAMGKLMTVHLNDQNGIRYDQDKSFGVENLRAAFNQVKVLIILTGTEEQEDTNSSLPVLDVWQIQQTDVVFRHIMKIPAMQEAMTWIMLIVCNLGKRRDMIRTI